MYINKDVACELLLFLNHTKHIPLQGGALLFLASCPSEQDHGLSCPYYFTCLTYYKNSTAYLLQLSQ